MTLTIEQARDRLAEEWRPCPDFEDDYAVSSVGRVKRIRNAAASGKAGLMMSPRTDRSGYVKVSLRKHRDAKQTHRSIHRFVARAFLGEPAAGLEVNHKDGVKSNNTVDNLEWVTRSENGKHAIHTLGRPVVRRGSASTFAKITEADAIAILELRGKGTPASEVGRRFNTSENNVYMIWHRRSWKHLDQIKDQALEY